MRTPLRLTGNSRLTLAVAMTAAMAALSPAQAGTAIFDASTPYAPGPMTALSTAGDNAGQFVGLGQWMSLWFAQPFGVSKTDTVSIFTLAPPTGTATLSISFGRFNNGRPIFADTKNVNAGNTLTVGNLFKKGCSALGGCDFIFITGTKAKGGATGATVDYVSVNGAPTDVTAPTPEPSVWAMMLIGFAGIAWRLKARRRYSVSSAKGALAMCSR